MDESDFARMADRALGELAHALEAALDADDPDIDLAGGILTLVLADKRKFILNKHAPTRQLWLSSPVSGASHYAFDQATQSWRSTRGPQILADQLAQDIAVAVGHPVAIG